MSISCLCLLNIYSSIVFVPLQIAKYWATSFSQYFIKHYFLYSYSLDSVGKVNDSRIRTQDNFFTNFADHCFDEIAFWLSFENKNQTF